MPSRGRTLLFVALAIAGAVLACPAGAQPPFTIETVASDPDHIESQGVVVDHEGQVFIMGHGGYYGPFTVKVFRRSEGGWVYDLLVAGNNQPPLDPRLAIGADGIVDAVWSTGLSNLIDHLSFRGGSWAGDRSVGNGFFPTNAVDATGTVAIAFLAPEIYPWHLELAIDRAASYEFETVDPGLAGKMSMAYDAWDRLAISYYSTERRDLRVATQRNGFWALETVDTTGDVGNYSSLALDSRSNPHVVYWDASHGQLKYATRLAGTWWTENIALLPGTTPGPMATLKVDARGNPRLAYYDSSRGDLVYGARLGGAWFFAAVDTAGDVGRDPWLWLDDVGEAHIAYTDDTHHSLKYAHQISPVAVEADAPWAPCLSPPSPNPGRGGRTVFEFALARPGAVTLAVYDAAGRLVARRAAERFPAGASRVAWNTGIRGSGLYFVQLASDSGERYVQRWAILF
jgi:hypothetical protein